MPKRSDTQWYPLGELSEDKTELVLPSAHKFGSGIQLRFEGMDTLENDLYVEKVTLLYIPMRTRIL